MQSPLQQISCTTPASFVRHSARWHAALHSRSVAPCAFRIAVAVAAIAADVSVHVVCGDCGVAVVGAEVVATLSLIHI